MSVSEFFFQLQFSAVDSTALHTCTMSHSDRSRSPTARRSGSALTRADLPGFPVWRGPMGQAVRAAHVMSQNLPHLGRDLCQDPIICIHLRCMSDQGLQFLPLLLSHLFLPLSVLPLSSRHCQLHQAFHLLLNLLSHAISLNRVHRLLLNDTARPTSHPDLLRAPRRDRIKSLLRPHMLEPTVLTSMNIGSRTKSTMTIRRSMV